MNVEIMHRNFNICWRCSTGGNLAHIFVKWTEVAMRK